MTYTDTIRLIVFASAIGGVVGCILFTIKHKNRWGYTVTPFLIALNIALFTGSRAILGPLPPSLVIIYNAWANITMLQVTLTIVGGLIILWKRG